MTVEVILTRAQVQTELRHIPLNSIVQDPQRYAFRDDADYKLDSKAIADLAESMQLEGIRVPVEVEVTDQGNLLNDGHRRIAGALKNVQDGKWQPDHPIPALVAVTPMTEQERLLRIGSINLSRKNWDDVGLIRFAHALSEQGCPETEIARVIGKSVKQVQRYLKIGGSPWALSHTKAHNIDASKLSGLLALADTNNCRADFEAQFDAWVATTKANISAENRRRDRNDQTLLKGDELSPQKYVTAEIVAVWKRGITTGNWDGPSFRFKATVAEDQNTGKRKLEIDRLSADLDRLTLEDTTKVYKRCRELAEQLEPVLLEKKQLRAITPAASSRTFVSSAAVARLAELGIDDAFDEDQVSDGDEDDGFDDVEVQDGEDLASTVELPAGPAAEQGVSELSATSEEPTHELVADSESVDRPALPSTVEPPSNAATAADGGFDQPVALAETVDLPLGSAAEQGVSELSATVVDPSHELDADSEAANRPATPSTAQTSPGASTAADGGGDQPMALTPVAEDQPTDKSQSHVGPEPTASATPPKALLAAPPVDGAGA